MQNIVGPLVNDVSNLLGGAKRPARPGKSVGKAPAWCWADESAGINLVLHDEGASITQRCKERHGSLADAQTACEAARPWCGGVTRDAGLVCKRGAPKLQFELRLADKVDAPATSVSSWLLHRKLKNSTRCEDAPVVGTRRAAARAQRAPGTHGGRDDRLARLLRANLLVAHQRVSRGPPAFERFPDQAFRYRDWGAQTRHGRGDMYPLYTLDTLRNLADHLFDSSTGFETGPERARQVQPCALLYSTLRPTSKFINLVHNHIKGPYLLMTDTADEPITAYYGVRYTPSPPPPPRSPCTRCMHFCDRWCLQTAA